MTAECKRNHIFQFTQLFLHELRCFGPTVLFVVLLSYPDPCRCGSNPLPINSRSDYLCYYGSWDDESLFRAKDFNLVILEPSNIEAQQIADLKKGHDGLAGTKEASVILSCDVDLDVVRFCPMNCGDVNGDGFTDSTDALIILSYDVGMTVPFPVGQAGCPSSVNGCAGCNP